jgi:hypothetical protein
VMPHWQATYKLRAEASLRDMAGLPLVSVRAATVYGRGDVQVHLPLPCALACCVSPPPGSITYSCGQQPVRGIGILVSPSWHFSFVDHGRSWPLGGLGDGVRSSLAAVLRLRRGEG